MYSLPTKIRSANCVLALDPGKTNMGISIVSKHGNRPKCLANAIMQNPLKSLKSDYLEQLDSFLQELDRWVDVFKPTHIAVERFQARGIRGNTGELVSVMIGAITMAYDLPIRPIIAAQWKGPFQKDFDIKLDNLYKVCKTTPHQLDATLIGVYDLEQRYGPMDYTLEYMLDSVEKSSLVQLHKRKQHEISYGLGNPTKGKR